MSFGALLRELRTERSLTQDQLAKQAGISKAYVSALEVGRKSAPPYAVVRAIAEGLRCEVDPLWTAAKAERARHLAQRISGTPASKRTSVRTEERPDPGNLSVDMAAQAIVDTISASGSDKRTLALLLHQIASLLEES
jgi:transcriptional regulator with XRE-family HTH domain